MAKKKATEENAPAHFAEIKIDHQNSGGLGLYSNHVLVQRTTDSFVLQFFQVTPPIIMTEDSAERAAELRKIKSINAEPVAKIFVSPEKFTELLSAMNRINLQTTPLAAMTPTDSPIEEKV